MRQTDVWIHKYVLDCPLCLVVCGRVLCVCVNVLCALLEWQSTTLENQFSTQTLPIITHKV